MTNRYLVALSGLLLAACSPQGQKTDSTRATADGEIATAASDTGMAGMDHSKMAMPDSTSPGAGAAAPMARMDHSTMPGMAQPGARKATSGVATSPGSMAGMDHSNMPGMQRSSARASGTAAPASGSMAGMDHSNMPGMQRPAARSPGRSTAAAGSMAGMDHSNMRGMAGMAAATTPAPAAQDAISPAMRTLVARLVQDPVVRERIQADSVLRNRWQDPDVRRILVARP